MLRGVSESPLYPRKRTLNLRCPLFDAERPLSPRKRTFGVVIPRRRLPSLVETLFGAKSPAQLARAAIGHANFLEKSTSGGNRIPVGH